MSVNDEKKICLKSDVVCTLFDWWGMQHWPNGNHVLTKTRDTCTLEKYEC